jgi:lysine-specific demethylase/histidyl-hydroxylase NO66
LTKQTELSRLLAPFPNDVFLRDYWMREHLLVSREAGVSQSQDSLRALDTLLQSRHLAAAFFEVFQNGVAAPVEQWSQTDGPSHRPVLLACPEKMLALYAQGSTLICNGIHKSVPAISQLCRQLGHELGFPVQANAYITPPGAQGFSKHADNHEVLALQLHGHKVWTLHPVSSVAVTIVTHPGDALYIPAGLAHEAASAEEASVHITLGLRAVYDWQLVEELASVARSHPLFQAPAETTLLTMMETLLREQPAGELIRRRSERLHAEDAGGWEGRFRDMLGLGQLTEESLVQARIDPSAKIVVGQGALKVQMGRRSISLPFFLHSTLAQLATGEVVVVREIKGLLSSEGKVELVRSLVKLGFLMIRERA